VKGSEAMRLKGVVSWIRERGKGEREGRVRKKNERVKRKKQTQREERSNQRKTVHSGF
jgi:hypothetical protein